MQNISRKKKVVLFQHKSLYYKDVHIKLKTKSSNRQISIRRIEEYRGFLFNDKSAIVLKTFHQFDAPSAALTNVHPSYQKIKRLVIQL